MQQLRADAKQRVLRAHHVLNKALEVRDWSEHERAERVKARAALDKLHDDRGQSVTSLKQHAKLLEMHCIHTKSHNAALREQAKAARRSEAQQKQLMEMAPDLCV